MKISINELRCIINEELRQIACSHPSEAYDHGFEDDDAFNEKSVYVPDDTKHSIRSWLKAMRLNR